MTAPDRPTHEREWLVPSAILTAGLGLAALLLMPIAGYHQVPPYFSHFLNWMLSFFDGVLLLAAFYLIHQVIRGVESPMRALWRNIIAHSRSYAAIAAGIALAGADMLFFMWIKPEVTAISPFWADPLLANIDRAIFRTDPWRFFGGIDLTFHAWAYSFFWAVAIMGTLLWLFFQPQSRGRSTSLLSYFALWSLFGPIGQYFLSSAGPIFYQRVGLGGRFAELGRSIPEVTQTLSGYLWDFHTSGTLGVGAGISAMPSLHIATVTWIILCFGSLRSKLTPIAVIFGLYIWALSVALGWHYAIDGVVGAAGAIASQWACGVYLRGRDRTAIVAHACHLPA